MKISIELLYHYHCDKCDKWWSVGDITPIPGEVAHCPHCGYQHIIPQLAELHPIPLTSNSVSLSDLNPSSHA